MLYMVVERFRNGDAGAVYARLDSVGRLAPEGLTYVSSWVSEDLTRCYQLMRTDERGLLDRWVSEWKDLVDFEIVAVVGLVEASQKVRRRGAAAAAAAAEAEA
ncbi:hypothetical protein BS50DRAFT_630906 [Corynespora cassiicola Philippines]|uniref:NIPSNAP domain-containing protein n=1 Tax=Corynespora cassiicola Philippines TaxID=1448308 RepID=A0A2T2NZP4_CORCC|nr:hypothetical protein BS50DRAFT_630906 [Corynespora cassiicola Philippines]